ncbi:hypothetical protein EC843_1011010 [Buttiauxella sp. JUb87]|uniref:hypothetical protein n=1 Tax=Buttiauxella sp. JUb87 TaxID=2485129 RepID=UPI0010610021|nr:hypothetical protein [Buttiauxella sp. JUb87]TDN54951.1 hypothetical protein EC843_1011010 [Buttiauxella sp. JUb87]
MKELRFYGASDDLFECEGAIREEIGCFNDAGKYHLKSSEGELLVVGQYLDTGLWSVGLSPVGEGAAVPPWPTSYSIYEHGYSTLLTLQVPDDTVLVMEDDD